MFSEYRKAIAAVLVGLFGASLDPSIITFASAILAGAAVWALDNRKAGRNVAELAGPVADFLQGRASALELVRRAELLRGPGGAPPHDPLGDPRCWGAR